MNRDDIIEVAREAGFDPHDMSDDFTCNLMDIERFANLVAAAEREKVAAWMMKCGYATGHGDSIEDLLGELAWQIEEKIAIEREACAKVCDEKVAAEYATGKVDHNEIGWAQSCAFAIRERGAP